MKNILALRFLGTALRAGMAPVIWDASFPPAEAYAVWIREAGTQPWIWRVTSSQPEARLEGLTPGIWEVQVTAIYGDYHSDPTNTITLTVPEFLPAPQNLRPGHRVDLQISNDMNHWVAVASVPVPDADRLFARAVFVNE